MRRALLIATLFAVAFADRPALAQERPNVLMIAVDDLNDWVGFLGGYPGTVHTPHMDRLAARGVAFVNAQTPSPQCQPARAAVFSGLMPYTSGVYTNAAYWRTAMPEQTTLPELLRANGYLAVGAGKVYHHTVGNNPLGQWDHFEPQVQDDHWHYDFPVPGQHIAKRGGPFWPEGFPLNGLEAVRQGERPPGNARAFDWGPFDQEDLAMGDGHAVRFAMDFLGKQHDAPFFLAVGIYRPHIPWYAPRHHFDRYPPDEVVLPPRLGGDLDDVPAAAITLKRNPGLSQTADGFEDFEYIQATGTHREAVRAYLASISFADALVGHLLDALDASAYADDTLIILWSDHGWHLGEKGHWHKATLWEEACRVPLVVAGPGVVPGRTATPVSLVDLYPTLVERLGLEGAPALDGTSLTPILRAPHVEVPRVAITAFQPGNYSVRSRRWRLIRYADGAEELYDHARDPYEWHNLALDPSYDAVRAALRAHLPEAHAAPAARRGAFTFDPATYTWTHTATGTVID